MLLLDSFRKEFATKTKLPLFALFNCVAVKTPIANSKTKLKPIQAVQLAYYYISQVTECQHQQGIFISHHTQQKPNHHDTLKQYRVNGQTIAYSAAIAIFHLQAAEKRKEPSQLRSLVVQASRHYRKGGGRRG